MAVSTATSASSDTRHREAPGELMPVVLFVFPEDPAAERPEDVLFQQLHQRRDQIGDHEAPDEGAEDLQKTFPEPLRRSGRKRSAI